RPPAAPPPAHLHQRWLGRALVFPSPQFDRSPATGLDQRLRRPVLRKRITDHTVPEPCSPPIVIAAIFEWEGYFENRYGGQFAHFRRGPRRDRGVPGAERPRDAEPHESGQGVASGRGGRAKLGGAPEDLGLAAEPDRPSTGSGEVRDGQRLAVLHGRPV